LYCIKSQYRQGHIVAEQTDPEGRSSRTNQPHKSNNETTTKEEQRKHQNSEGTTKATEKTGHQKKQLTPLEDKPEESEYAEELELESTGCGLLHRRRR